MRILARYVSVLHATGRGAAERWASQYGPEWRPTSTGPSMDIHAKLCALGPNPSIKDVAEVIGNKSWSYLSCDGCGDDVEKAVQIGSSDYGAEVKKYCLTCLREALSVAEAP